MDATPPTSALATADDGALCDQCGYPRTGLAADALCPECGEPPPRPAAHVTAANLITATHLSQLRAVTVGLVLLLCSSVTALGVTLVMDVGPLSLASLNAPAPKIFAAALVQRSIGGRPGPWGVSATTAALLAVVGIWLVTTPRSLHAEEEPPFSLRRLARWTPVLLVGAALGLLLSGAEPYIPARGDWSVSWIGLMVIFVELPANALLYLYLRQLARESRDRRAIAAFDRLAWLVPLTVGGAAAILIYTSGQRMMLPSAKWPLPARAGLAVYGAAAVAVGAAATAGVLRLTAAFAGVAVGTWTSRAAGVVVARVPRAFRTALSAIRRDPARWSVLAGIVLWVWTYWHVAGGVLASPLREGVRGTVPMLDFPGPKVPLGALASEAAHRYTYYNHPPLRTVLLTLAAIWLMTWPGHRRPGRINVSPKWVRRGMLLLCSLALAAGAFERAKSAPELFDHTRIVAFAVTALETVATALVYLRLATVAAAIGQSRLARRLILFGLAAAALDLLPLGPFGLNPHDHRNSFAYGLLCAAQVAGMFAVTFFCIGALTRLAWALGTDGGSEGRLDGREVVAR